MTDDEEQDEDDIDNETEDQELKPDEERIILRLDRIIELLEDIADFAKKNE